jgi:hypothetical protein
MQNNIVGAVERKPHMVRTVSFGRDMMKMLWLFYCWFSFVSMPFNLTFRKWVKAGLVSLLIC